MKVLSKILFAVGVLAVLLGLYLIHPGLLLLVCGIGALVSSFLLYADFINEEDEE